MSTVDVDSRGRVYIPKHLREKHGEKYRIIELKNGIKLIPLEKDPIKGLEKATQELKNASFEELEKTIDEEAQEEVVK